MSKSTNKVELLRAALPDFAPGEPACPHFGTCGGCSLQDVAYADQVRMKQAQLEQMFGLPVEMVPSPDPYGYRQRMDYVFAFGRAGLRERGQTYHVLDLTACPIAPPRVFAAFETLRQVLRDADIADYDYRCHEGVLRYLVFRHAATTDQLLINVIAASDAPELQALLDAAQDAADGVALCVTDQTADVSTAPVVRQYGSPTIEERLGGMTFEYGPNSFTQNNMRLAERMYEHIVEQCTGPVLDAFCGVGTIACLAARRAPQVWAVEVVEEAVELARRNAVRNGVTNVEFTCDTTRRYLKAAVEKALQVDTVILDPPRSGTAKKVIARSEALEPARILYVACNPRVFQTELAWFERYRPTGLTAFDLFPQTPHVELVVQLEAQ